MIKSRKYIFGAATFLWMLSLYGFSAETGTVSGGKSKEIAAFIEKIFAKISAGCFSYDKSAVIFEISHIIRKSAHVAGFMLLGMLVFFLIESISEKKKKLLPIVFTVLYAMADEFHQSLVPGRGPSVNDVGIDSCGAILGVMLAFLLLSHLRKNIRELKF